MDILHGYRHIYIGSESKDTSITLLLLHRTGGTESDLIPLARTILPGAGMLCPRGNVLENGMPRFFRRFAEGIFDKEDIRFRAEELAGFITEASETYGFNVEQVLAIGYSNGANIATALLLLQPGMLSGAILFRPMVPLVPEKTPDLSDVPVLISAGERDLIVSQDETDRLVYLLQYAGADVTLNIEPDGHELTEHDADVARDWLHAYSSTIM